MVTSDTSQSPGAEARSCTGPLGGYGAAPEDTSPPLPLQDPTRGAETMRRRRLSEAAGPHLLHRSIEPPISEFESWFPSHYGYLTLEKEPILSLSFFICSTQQGIRNHFLPVQLTLRCPESRTVLRSKRIPKDICLMESQPLQLLLTPALTPRKLTLQKWSQPASWKNPRDDWSCSRPIFETHNWKLGLLSRTQRFLKSEGT
ncbi:uncharacterized protein LOC121825012 isoform X1 [Peromyscus maniculatus bairdii]|uniref:uncharacterized protein LOC121825012 isoform X1 n=1 Tax=Peromyscus maniculatus bairdii TaxID=230844 RepID=UPI001C2E4630|nr:uncharacterized protein LOC121825012 isoform X1 [Peromyscus maniculatus bairdii]